MLAYAWKSLGWFLAGIAVALGFLLVPLQVAAERKKLDRTVSDIIAAKRDIRALETEFDTRANLAQLEKWNGDTLRLTAPAAGQFVSDEGTLAAMNVNGSGQNGEVVQTAALVVPSLPDVDTAPHVIPAVATRIVDTPAAPAAPTIPAAKSAPAVKAAPIAKTAPAPVRLAVAPVVAPRVQPVAAHRSAPQAVAMLDRKLLSDTTLGDLMSTARTESRAR